ncbi:MAG: response regulator transcription factor [Bacteroidetes bacterium]|nr:response regulator transcription factor [Bacteroidota bacterium]
MSLKFTCIVVDDDDIDRMMILSLLEKFPFIEIKGSFASASAALELAKKAMLDIVFLDIDMPETNGLNLRKQLLNIPACIFITSYSDFALDGYELEALDYLVKPLHLERFSKSIDRVRDYLTARQKSILLDHVLGPDTIFIKDGHNQIKLNLHEIVYLEAMNNYTGIITNSKRYTVLVSLGNLLKENAFKSFIRIHKSYAVQKNYVKEFRPDKVIMGDIILPIGRSFKDSLKQIKEF